MAVSVNAGEIKDESLPASKVFTTSSNSIVAGDVIVAFIQSEGGTTPDEPVVTGTGGFNVTYTKVASDDDVLQFYAFRAVAGSSTSGTMTFTFTDNRVDNVVYGFCTLAGVNQATSQGVVQSAVDGRKAGAGGFSTGGGTLNLGSFADSANATLGIFTHNQVTTMTPGAGFSTVEHHGTAETAAASSAVIQFRTDNDQTVDCTWSQTTQRSFGIALELDGTTVATDDVTFVDGATATSVTNTVSVAKADIAGLSDGDFVVVHLGAHANDATGWSLSGWTQVDLKNTS
jgi:hypothetical protein